MKTRNFYRCATLSLALGLLLAAATAFARGGVGVGNGRMVYQSPKGFVVEYREELSLAVRSNSEFEISNRELVQERDAISRVNFLVDEREIKSLGELKKLLALEYPARTFQLMKLAGAEGYFWEERAANELRGEYFIRTEKNLLVRVTLVAHAAGNGLDWVAPVVRTFTYDETAPVILAVAAEGSSWESGTVQALRLRVRETNSGLSKKSGYVSFQRYDEGGKPTEGRFFLGTYKFNWTQEDEENHRVELSIPGFLPPGRYLLKSFTISDLAGNLTAFAADNPNLENYPGTGTNGRPALPLVWVTITNAGLVDTTPPRVTAIRVDSHDWLAGEKHKVYFQVKEEGSGLTLDSFSCHGIHSFPFVAGKTAYSSKCGNPMHEGGDWYSLELDLDPYLPEGEYVFVSVSIEDKAGNYFLASEHNSDRWYQSKGEDTDLPLLKVRVTNSASVDTTDPVIHEWYLESNVWKAGSTQRLYFRAEDDLAGIGEFRGFAPHGWLKPVGEGDESLSRTIYIDRDIVSVGNGWFYAEIEVSAFIRGGEFYISHFSVADRAGNADTVRCSLEESCENKGGTELPQLKVTIER